MVASTIHKEQNMRPRKLLGQIVQEDLKAFRICCRQDQEHTRPVFGTYRSIQVGELPNELAGDFGSYPLGSPTRSRAVHPTEPSFISKHNSQRAALSRCKKASLGHLSSKPFFLSLLAPPNPGPDETDAASTCASHGGPEDCRSCCCLLGAQSPFHRLLSSREYSGALRRLLLSQIA